MRRFVLAASFCLVMLVRVQAQDATVLGIEGTRFTLNGKPVFLLGISYYGGLGAAPDFVRRDLDDVQRYGFNWLRVWATWDGFGNDVSAVDAQGRPREPFLGNLQRLVAECDRRGLVVDVTFTHNKGGLLSDYATHLRAIETVVDALKPHRNWYLDLANERDVRDDRYVGAEELRQWRARVRRLDPQRLVTASFGGHDLSVEDVRESLLTIGLDFVSPHRPRTPESPGQTEAKTRECLDLMKQIGRMAPVHHQEPFRRGYEQWEPSAADFLTDLRGAVAGGAAGWCFHNGTQRNAADQQPRRSFDLRGRRLFDQLDSEERKVVAEAAQVLRDVDGSAFPLSISENRRYLVDRHGRPFLIHGDSPWEIIWQLKKEEAVEYLDHRVAQGFNTVLVNLIPDKVAGNNHPWTKNRYGVQVFRDPNDFTTAVPEYFDHAEWFVLEAGKRGLLVLLFPCYLGADTTWIDDLHANGVEKARAYGQFVAERFAKYPNLIWVMGGDRDPEYARAEHDALAEAIHTHDPMHLMTFHGSVHSSSTLYHDAPWLDLNMSYNYRETYVQAHEDYRRTPVKPTFLSESGYEREANDNRYGTPQRMRRQAYWTLLAGSCGHLYGSSFWHLAPGWRDSLDWPGVRQMKHVRGLFESLPWHQFVPQFEKELILDGQGEYGSREDYITAAATPDHRSAALYMPIARRVKLNLALFPRPVHARWFDPTNGIYSEAGDQALPNRGEHWLAPPARECDSDWVLLLEAVDEDTFSARKGDTETTR